MRPTLEVADILRVYSESFTLVCNPLKYHRKVLSVLLKCRTQALGGHIERCSDCSFERIAYNSCRNRHCPKCQRANTDRWIDARKDSLPDCQYFHCVFTLPEVLNIFCLNYPEALYNILFQASKDTIETLGKDPGHLGARTGAISVLHTWGQNLQLHPHVHIIVPGGGVDTNGRWLNSRSNGRYLFPVHIMSRVFRGKFMQAFDTFMESLGMYITPELKKELYAKAWVVYAKRPFGGVDQVIEYLGRYTHKIAISNHRLKSIADGKVTFSYKDYRHGGSTKEMTLCAHEFLRRLCLHILPRGFRKIRHYGILASHNRQLLQGLTAKTPQTEGEPMVPIIPDKILRPTSNPEYHRCPCCQSGHMIRIRAFDANGPPMMRPQPELLTL